jgi:septal ring factor EnvC (AmiA/AmiB activator)
MADQNSREELGKLTSSDEPPLLPLTHRSAVGKDTALAAALAALAERDPVLAAKLSAALAEKDAEKDAALAEKDAEQDAALAEKDAELAEKDAALAEQDAALAEKDAELAEKDAALAEQDAALAEKDAEKAAAVALSFVKGTRYADQCMCMVDALHIMAERRAFAHGSKRCAPLTHWW